MRAVSGKPSELPPAAMAPLARLPVFLDVERRTVVLAGNTAALAWKVELVAAAGADVHVYAEAPVPELRAALGRQPDRGSIVWHRRRWCAADLAGAGLAIADPDGEAQATAFAAAAAAARVPVNLVDRPALCGFQFGSIINRSPVIVAISTGGAVPVLGQTIRRRIETLLPPGIAAWAALAAGIRAVVKCRLPDIPRRRVFWGRFADRAFGPPPSEQERTAVAALLDGLAATAKPSPGRVTLVGAGPGSADHLTLGAVRAMQSADVILFDDRVSVEVLELARREARRLPVGRPGDRAGRDRTDHRALMLSLASSGKHVVRLVAGTPASSGRDGEAIKELRCAGIAVDVVPDITTAAAVPGLSRAEERRRGRRSSRIDLAMPVPRSHVR